MVSSFLEWICSELYAGPFTKVAWVDLTEVVEGGTATRYEWAAPIPVPTKASGAWLRGLFDLGILAARKSSLTSLNFTQKVSKYK
jgi:hypothetical protein